MSAFTAADFSMAAVYIAEDILYFTVGVK